MFRGEVKMGKVDDNKQQKLRALLDTSFELFTRKGMANTSISDITTSSGIAKGTFYLYFKDKYDIRNKLVAYESRKILRRAYEASYTQAPVLSTLEERVLSMVDQVVMQLSAKPELLKLISRQLSWGILKREVIRPLMEDDFDFAQLFLQASSEYGISQKDSEIMLYLIVELVGSACYSAIVYQEPCSMEALKPRLFDSVRLIVRQFEGGAANCM